MTDYSSAMFDFAHTGKPMVFCLEDGKATGRVLDLLGPALDHPR